MAIAKITTRIPVKNMENRNELSFFIISSCLNKTLKKFLCLENKGIFSQNNSLKNISWLLDRREQLLSQIRRNSMLFSEQRGLLVFHQGDKPYRFLLLARSFL